MKKNLFLLGLLVCSMATMAQTEKAEKPESWYFKLGGSYFNQTASTEFPTVSGHDAMNRTYVGGKLVSEKSITGSFGQGFRTGITAGYRFSTRIGVELGVNYYTSNDKTMAQTTSDQPYIAASGTYNFKSVGQITAFDVAPAIVMFLGETNGFEPYTKVGVLVPIHGDLEIKTDAFAPVGVNPGTGAPVFGNVHSVDKVKPNPTIGFTAAVGTTYKLTSHLSAFAELEYRNFTVHGKTKETTEFTVNGNDALASRTTAQIHTNYRDGLDVNSNNAATNPNGVNKDKPMDELSSYVGISGLGLTLGVKYSL
ncbi:outer membrane beta-barrel protein [uncultured Flavobacterium sp.]|uniref:outer membrane beta-barrel protein n=1 Tax=uncultured Flavobacterium sp. TaxID=165435 RepID=UPI0025EF77A8|nr:outer membrane beta-barrel protein [uncultured Flavobacterium sp.]